MLQCLPTPQNSGTNTIPTCCGVQPSPIYVDFRNTTRFYQSWPGLTAAAIRKHLPKSEATTKGHLDQSRKNLRSTKTDDMDLEEEQEPNNTQTHQIFAAIENTDRIYTGKIYTGQTGRFPVTSSQGNKYILVLY
jgi:hypothetical protein